MYFSMNLLINIFFISTAGHILKWLFKFISVRKNGRIGAPFLLKKNVNKRLHYNYSQENIKKRSFICTQSKITKTPLMMPNLDSSVFTAWCNLRSVGTPVYRINLWRNTPHEKIIKLYVNIYSINFSKKYKLWTN